MAHFAQINETTNLATMVAVLNNDQTTDANGNEDEAVGAALLEKKFGGRWIQTSYNTCGGVHRHEGKVPLRGNYAGVGFKYDEQLDIFHPPQPYPSWTLDGVKGQWNPPVPMPEMEDGVLHTWNEEEQQWDEINMEDNNG